jgi:hypothetical protein
VPERIDRLMAEMKELRDELAAQRKRASPTKRPRSRPARSTVSWSTASTGADDLRELAVAVRDALGSGVVGLGRRRAR